MLGDSDGTKYPLFIVLKQKASTVAATVQENNNIRNGFGRSVYKDIEVCNERWPSQINGNPSAWWNENISVKFLRYHFGNRPDMEQKVLLLWDDFSGHWTESVLNAANELNIVLLKVPPRFTWSCQPADVAWNKPLKTFLRRRWIDFLMLQIKNHRGDQPFIMEPPDRITIVDWINEAWDSITYRTIISGFSRCNLLYDQLPPPYHVPDDEPANNQIAHNVADVLHGLHALERDQFPNDSSLFD